MVLEEILEPLSPRLAPLGFGSVLFGRVLRFIVCSLTLQMTPDDDRDTIALEWLALLTLDTSDTRANLSEIPLEAPRAARTQRQKWKLA